MARVKTNGRKLIGFELHTEPGTEVFVAGTFNNWNPWEYPMKDNPQEGHFKTEIMLPRGRYEYKFIVNGDWRPDPNCSESATNSYGSLNSVLLV